MALLTSVTAIANYKFYCQHVLLLLSLLLPLLQVKHSPCSIASELAVEGALRRSRLADLAISRAATESALRRSRIEAEIATENVLRRSRIEADVAVESALRRSRVAA
jgi:hypothetical protein